MKKIIILSISIFLFSCQKDDPESLQGPGPQPSANGSIQYKVNGVLVVMDNTDIATGQYVLFAKQLKGSILNETRYLLNAQKGVNNLIIFAVAADSLHLGNYHYDSTIISNRPALAVPFLTLTNAQEAAMVFSGDNFDINITSYKNSRISGTFTGKITPLTSVGGFSYANRGTVNITEGVINNVLVIY